MSVERILSKNQVDYLKTGSYFKVNCLSPDHEDKNPSMFINEFTGWANCKSCGVSYNIYELFNEKADWLSIRKQQFREKMRKVAADSIALEIPSDAVFHKSSYRGISAKTIKEFQGFQTSEFPGYLFFPLKDNSGRILNFVGRDTTGTRPNKYMMLHTKPVLMAPTNNAHLNSIILVEGWFDALNLWDKGLTNVRAIFGAVTFREEHVEKLKIEGIDEVIIMLDGDKAGRDAAREIKEMLDEAYVSNKIVNLPDGTDPGDMTADTVSKLKGKLYGKSSNRRNETKQEQLQEGVPF